MKIIKKCSHIGALVSRPESRLLSESTRRIAPPTKNGHAPPPTESRKSYRSVNPTGVRTGRVFPCWVKLSRRLHSRWCPSVNSFKFQLCNHTSPGTELCFPAGYLLGHGSERRQIAGRHRLRSELRRYLIVFEPLTFALDQRKRACHTPSLQLKGEILGSLHVLQRS